MKTLIVSVILSIWISIYCVNAQEKRVPVNVDTLNFGNVDQILHALKDYESANRPPSVPKSVKQFTSTTVLAEEEVNNINWMTHDGKSKFPDTFTSEDRRIRVQYNENDNTDHGEKILLEKYIDGLIVQMQTNSRENNYNTYPIVIMYSYNIPCSISDHTCAQKLHDDKQKRIGKPTEYSMIVGFSLFFQFRGNKDKDIQNRRQSFAELTEQNIRVQMNFNMYKNIQFASLVLQDKHINGDVAFQSIMFDCLIKQPVVYNCIVNENDITRIVAFSIDSMFYYCRKKAGNYRNTGTWENSSLQKCLNRWIKENIGDDCQKYGQQEVWKFLLEETIKQGRRMATYIAEPFKYNSNSNVSTWTRSQLTTQEPITPEEYLRNCRPMFLCRTPSYPGYFCTKMKDTNGGVSGSRNGSPPRKKSRVESVKTSFDQPGNSQTRDL